MNELQEKIARLPAWAREHIKRLEVRADPNNGELLAARQKVEKTLDQMRRLQGQVDAMTEIFRCAARGGSETAQAYVDRVLADYTSELEV